MIDPVPGTRATGFSAPVARARVARRGRRQSDIEEFTMLALMASAAVGAIVIAVMLWSSF